MKKVLIGIGIVLLILGVLIWQVAANLDSFVAGMIEDTGSDVLKTRVSVSGVSINLKEGKAAIGGLTVANPDGFSRANLFDLEGIEVDLDLSSLGKDVLVIESIRVHNPQIVFEADKAGGSNMQALLDNIDSGPSADTGAADGDNSGSAGIRMIIQRFEFTGGRVKATTPIEPGEVTELKLPAIKMSGIGRAEGGVTADVVMQEITSELVNSVIESALRAGINKVLEKKTKSFQDKLADIVRGKEKD